MDCPLLTQSIQWTPLTCKLGIMIKEGDTIIVFHLVFSAEQERSFGTANKICPTSPFGPKLLSQDISLSVVVANAAYVTSGKVVSSPGELLTGSSGLIELP